MNRKKVPDNFNPYHKWLGIPEKKCPPTFYELLGISLDEDDPKVIQSAAERQKTHVEQFLGTSYNKYANQLISQIDEAEITLLSPELRREYDRQADLFKKRRKKRQFDPTVGPSSIRMSGNRTVGEGSGIAREFAGIVTVLAVVFFCIAAASFWLPWGKLEVEKQVVDKTKTKPEQPVLVANDINKVDENEPSEKAVTPAKLPDPKTYKEFVNSIGMKFKQLPSGTFVMGDFKHQEHKVQLTKPFYMGVYEVTQAQYEKVMGSNPSAIKKTNQPVEQVSWNDAQEFCSRLSGLKSEHTSGRVYRLPTEIEWEYACRAGTTTKYSFGHSDEQLKDYAWYLENTKQVQPVGLKRPNPWGLYDMHGNVFEWCQDWLLDYPQDLDGKLSDKNQVNSADSPEGEKKVFRGGGIGGIARSCHSAYRGGYKPTHKVANVGFRIVMELQDAEKSMSENNGLPIVDKPTKSPEALSNSIGIEFKLIRPGKFKMGSKLRHHNEKPEHSVTLTNQFYLGATEVTQEHYEQVMGYDKNRSRFRGPRNPVESASWEDAKIFCRRLSDLPEEKKAGYVYRLPTEEEWEYACRAGSISKYCFGDDVTKLRGYAWYGINSQKTTHAVGEKLPNDWGLFDMHGNVWEWTESSEGARRVSRGGAWASSASGCRSPVRGRDAPSYKSPFIGFRIVLDLTGSKK